MNGFKNGKISKNRTRDCSISADNGLRTYSQHRDLPSASPVASCQPPRFTRSRAAGEARAGAALTTLVSAYTTAKNAAVAAIAAAEEATGTKDDALENLTDAMKSDIRYAENKVNYDDDKLKLIGWAGKKNPTPLAIPGQARLLEASRQGGEAKRPRPPSFVKTTEGKQCAAYSVECILDSRTGRE